MKIAVTPQSTSQVGLVENATTYRCFRVAVIAVCLCLGFAAWHNVSSSWAQSSPDPRSLAQIKLPLSQFPGDDFPLAPYLRSLPFVPKSQQQQAWAFLDQGDYSKGIELLETSAQRLPTSQQQQAVLQLAHLCLSLGDENRAIGWYRSLFVSQDPAMVWPARVMMARNLLQNLQPTQAWRVLQTWPLALPRVLIASPSRDTSSLQEQQRRNLREFWIAGHLLRAQAAAQAGQAQHARESYQALRKTPIAIADWLAYQQIQVSASQKNYTLVRQQAVRWLQAYAQSRWRPQVRLLQARALEQTAACRLALPLYDRLFRSGHSDVARAARLGHTRCLLSLQQINRAYLQLREMSRSYAGSWYAAQALQLWKQRFPRKEPTLFLYHRAYHAYRARQWELADSRFQTFLQQVDRKSPARGMQRRKRGQTKPTAPRRTARTSRQNTKTSRRKHKTLRTSKTVRQHTPFRNLIPLALYYRGQALFHRKQYIPAMGSLSRMNRQFPQHRLRQSARLLWIRSRYREVKTAQAIRHYEQFANQHKGTQSGQTALWWAAQLYSEHGEFQKSMALFQRYLQAYPGSSRRAEARIKMALVLYQQGKYQETLRWLRPLLSSPGDAGVRALFWTAKTHERLKQHPQAAQWLRKIGPLSDSYYAARAAERLRKRPLLATKPVSLFRLLSDEKQEIRMWQRIQSWLQRHAAPTASLSVLSRQITEHPSYRRAYIFALAGRWREVRQEWDFLQSQQKHPFVIYAKARAWLSYGNPNRALYWAQRFRMALSPEQRRHFPSMALLRLTFPVPFPFLYTVYATKYRVRPLLMMALTRQESLFHPQAVSGAGARGIAQIMPKEGQRLANKWNLADYHPQHLFRVGLNLRMGAAHFREYLDLHNNDVTLTLAAYNAGPHSLKRWLQQHASLYQRDPEAFIEYGIGYRETRDYVRNCLRWYSVYRQAFSTARQTKVE